MLAQITAPITLRRLSQRRRQTVHVIATITVITKQELVIILRAATHGTSLALDTQPLVPLDRLHNVGIEAKTRGGMKLLGAFRAGDEFLILVRLTARFLFNTKTNTTLNRTVRSAFISIIRIHLDQSIFNQFKMKFFLKKVESLFVLRYFFGLF